MDPASTQAPADLNPILDLAVQFDDALGDLPEDKVNEEISKLYITTVKEGDQPHLSIHSKWNPKYWFSLLFKKNNYVIAEGSKTAEQLKNLHELCSRYSENEIKTWSNGAKIIKCKQRLDKLLDHIQNRKISRLELAEGINKTALETLFSNLHMDWKKVEEVPPEIPAVKEIPKNPGEQKLKDLIKPPLNQERSAWTYTIDKAPEGDNRYEFLLLDDKGEVSVQASFEMDTEGKLHQGDKVYKDLDECLQSYAKELRETDIKTYLDQQPIGTYMLDAQATPHVVYIRESTGVKAYPYREIKIQHIQREEVTGWIRTSEKKTIVYQPGYEINGKPYTTIAAFLKPRVASEPLKEDRMHMRSYQSLQAREKQISEIQSLQALCAKDAPAEQRETAPFILTQVTEGIAGDFLLESRQPAIKQPITVLENGKIQYGNWIFKNFEDAKKNLGIDLSSEQVKIAPERDLSLDDSFLYDELLDCVFVRQESSFTTFNQQADGIKSQSDWKQVLEQMVSRASEQQLKTLTDVSPREFRGYDREVLTSIYRGARMAIAAQPSRFTQKELSQINSMIDALRTAVWQVPDTHTKVLGGGAVNQVDLVTLPDRQIVFKPDPAELPMKIQAKEQYFGTATASGIPAGNDGHLAHRAVASSVVDKLLFKDSPISVHTDFAVVNGKRGIFMEKAEGKSPKVKGREVNIDLSEHPNVKTFLEEKKWELQPDQLEWMAEQLNFKKVIITNKGTLVGFKEEFSFDPHNATTAEGLIKLQVLDVITGQVDRHPGNYFIDPKTGQVTGIDQDCSFGVASMPKDVDVRKQPHLMRLIPNNASLMLRLPTVITSAIQKQINDLYDNRETLHAELSLHISDAEIEATIDRLRRLREHINNKDTCTVVASKEELLSPKVMARMDSNNSYLMRELLVYDSNKEGWNHIRAWREE